MLKLKFEYKITAIYLIVGGIWIIFSDELLRYFINDSETMTRIQTYKGWFYVTITAFLFYIVLNRHLVKLRKAEHKAKESDRLKTAFIQNISHEIRTPMNGIMGFSELLKSDNITETEKRTFISIIGQSSNQLLNIINEVLDISMIEAGNMAPKKNQVNLNELLSDIYSSFKPLLNENITFSLNKGLPDLSGIILTDAVKITQILNNLISNAIKFTDKGKIEFGYSLKNNELEFFVKDTGIGIDPVYHKKIFERFQKADTNNNRLYEGVGLGLSICKGNIDLLNGKIWINSEPGIGSTMFFIIPYEPVSLNSNNSDNNIATNNKLIEGQNHMTVLVAEDDDANFRYINHILKSLNLDILHAVNGLEAVEICRNNSNISIILMDIKMPRMNGYDAIKEIKAFRPDIPIIVQTAFAMEGEREKAMKLGCQDYISKPFGKDELISMIVKYQPK